MATSDCVSSRLQNDQGYLTLQGKLAVIFLPKNHQVRQQKSVCVVFLPFVNSCHLKLIKVSQRMSSEFSPRFRSVVLAVG